MSRTVEAAPSPEADIREVERFPYDEAALIDRRRFDDWLALFAEDCRYWLPLEEGQVSGHDTVSLIYDDRLHLETRVRRLSHPRMHAQSPASRTCHMVSNVVIDGTTDAGALDVRSSLIVVEFRNDSQRLFAGHQRHHLLPASGGFRIALKRIDLIDSEGEHAGIPIVL